MPHVMYVGLLSVYLTFCAAVRQLFFDTERRIYAVPFTCVSVIECLLGLTCITILIAWDEIYQLKNSTVFVFDMHST